MAHGSLGKLSVCVDTAPWCFSSVCLKKKRVKVTEAKSSPQGVRGDGRGLTLLEVEAHRKCSGPELGTSFLDTVSSAHTFGVSHPSVSKFRTFCLGEGVG